MFRHLTHLEDESYGEPVSFCNKFESGRSHHGNDYLSESGDTDSKKWPVGRKARTPCRVTFDFFLQEPIQ